MTDKIEKALNENRILVLVAQVVLGFQYQSFFQYGFDRLPSTSRYLKLAGLLWMLLALCLLMLPSAYHRIVEEGRLSRRLLRFITKAAMPALLPFAFGLSLDFYVAAEKVCNRPVGILVGALTFVTALFFWYGIEGLASRPEKRAVEEKSSMAEEPISLKDKIKFVMMEVRVVLPGAQALLGFQFAALLQQSFDRLPGSIKYTHLACLACIGLCCVLLMTPAAFHRIAEQGEDTERLHTFSSRMLLAAMFFLGLGIAGDLLVVVYKITESFAWAFSGFVLALLVFYGAWFGYTWLQKSGSLSPISQSHPQPSK